MNHFVTDFKPTEGKKMNGKKWSQVYKRTQQLMKEEPKLVNRFARIATRMGLQDWEKKLKESNPNAYILRDALVEEENDCLTYRQNNQVLKRILDKVGKVRLTPYSLGKLVDVVGTYSGMSAHGYTDLEIFQKENYDILDLLEDTLKEIKITQDTYRNFDKAHRRNVLREYGYQEGTKLFERLENADPATWNRDLVKFSPNPEVHRRGKNYRKLTSLQKERNKYRREQYLKSSKEYHENNG